MDVPLKNYSSGMHMRLGFAIAAQLDPDILLLDEIFAVGDEDFQKQCMRTMQRFQADGRTILFVSHSAAAVQAICRRVCVLDRGRLLYDGDVDTGLTHYRRLIAASTRGRGRQRPSQRSRRGRTTTRISRGIASRRAATGTREGEWVVDTLRRQGLQAGSVRARGRVREPVRGEPAAAGDGPAPLLGLRAQPRAVRRGRPHRAAAGRRRA